jgi:hypothetical protein
MEAIMNGKGVVSKVVVALLAMTVTGVVGPGGGPDAYAAPAIAFVPPTPDDGAIIADTSVEIQVSIVEQYDGVEYKDLWEVIFRWDATDHWLYDDSLVLMFNFDNVEALGEDYSVAGGVVKDLSGSGNDGYLSDVALDPYKVPTWIPDGRYGGAFDFTGNGADIGQSIRVPHDNSMNPYGGEGDFALLAWIRTRHDVDGDILRKGSTEVSDAWYKLEHSPGDGSDRFSLNFNTTGTDATINSTEAYNDNQWHFVVAQRRSGQAELWIDGMLDGTAPVSGSIFNEADLAIGSKDTQNDDFLNSTVDEVRIYNNRSFSQDEIAELYYSNLSKYEPGSWILYVNQSNLADGVHTYKAGAKDTTGQLTETEVRSLEVAPSQKPTVSLDSPRDGSVVNSTEVVFTCSASATDDDFGLEDASLYVGDAPQTVTFSGPSQTDDAQLYATDDSYTTEVEGPDTNAGDAVSINVDGANPHAHGVIKFLNVFGDEPGQIPLDSAISSATLEINYSNGGNVMKLYRLTEDWIESQVTWNERSSGVEWTDPGADGTDSHAETALEVSASGTGWRTIDITQFVQEWSDGAANYGIVLTDGGTDGVDFDSSESANPPVLTVSYRQSGLELIETKPMSGMADTVFFSWVAPTDQQDYTWNCLVRNEALLESWAPADFHLTVDTRYPDEPTLVAPADGASDVAIPATLEVTVGDPQVEELLNVTFFGRCSAADEFTIIVLPDTQKYVLGGAYPQIFTAQTQWIVDNKDALNIVFVTHEGDIVDTWNNTTEWGYANTSMSLLDGIVPYSVVPGDHDHYGEDPPGSTEYYEQYFPASRFANAELYWYWGGSYAGNFGGSYDETYPHTNNNNFQLLTIGGQDYIFLSLDFCPSQDEIDWANGILTTYSERRAILTTHALLDSSANYYGSGDFWLYPDGTSNPTGDTSRIWYDLIRNHENLQLVLCGHMRGEVRRTDNNLFGKPVHQVMANYQDRANGGNGWLRIMRFVPPENKIYVKTYSPWLDQYETDADSQFELDMPMSLFTEIGTNLNVANGSSTSVTWPDLTDETEYEWYVTVTDPTDRTAVGPVWGFTTIGAPPVISGVDAVSITETTAAIVWTTDEPADSLVNYGTDDGYGLWVWDEMLVTSHSVTLTALSPGTTYHYQVSSEDGSGNAAWSADYTFTTEVPDTEPPAIVGATGDTASTTGELVTISATITDNVAVVSATVYYTPIDGIETTVSMTKEGGSDVWSADVPVASDKVGTITYYITAQDAAENAARNPAGSGTYGITITDNDDPVISGATGDTTVTFGESVMISATITDNIDVVSATLHFTPIASAEETTTNMTEGADNVWSASILSGSAEGTIPYYITADDGVPITTREPETGTYSITVSAPVLFSDGFESGDFTAGGWAVTSTPASVDGTAAYTGAYGAHLKKGATIEKSVSTAGFTEIHVKYARKTEGLKADEFLYVEWYDGSSWHELESMQDSAWGSEDKTCVGADNNADFKIRFRINGNAGNDEAMVDDVQITSTPSGPDIEAPMPDPMEWATAPYATGSTSIAMVAATASDASGVEYYFACIGDGGHDSGWQDGPTYEDTGLSAGIEYTYQVQARDKSPQQNTTGWSIPASATPTDVPPAPPTGLVATPGDSQVNLDWNDNTEGDFAGYNVYRSETSGGPYTQIATLVATSDYPDSPLVNGTTYYYVVTAVDLASNESGNSNEASATPSAQVIVHIESISMSLTPTGKNIKAEATALVHDQSDVPVQGATVVGDWYLEDKVIATGYTGITDSTGIAVSTSPPEKATSGETFRFEITDVVLSGYIYDPGSSVTSGSIAVP